jgi:homocysteine S-methyltransferase
LQGSWSAGSALVALDACGIHDVLAVTGDPAPRGDENTHSVAKALCQEPSSPRNIPRLISTDLARLAGEWAEESFSKPFSVSAALNVNAPNFDAELRKAERKISAGVTRFLTQPVLSEEALINLGRAYSQLDATILGGILPVVSLKNALFLEEHISGIRISREIISLYKNASKEESQHLASSIAIKFARAMANITDGWYIITPFRRVELSAQIVVELNAIRKNLQLLRSLSDKDSGNVRDSGLTAQGTPCYKVS